MNRRFLLAPMSPLIRGLTIFLLTLPLFFGGYALVWRQGSAWIIVLFFLVLYVAIWLWCRPSSFIVSPSQLAITFPLWQRRIAIKAVYSVRLIDQKLFQQEFGWALRVGVGGLWGGFGWLWTRRRGLVEFYISRLDRFVLIEHSKGKYLLITPEKLEQFVDVMQQAMVASNT